nr:unnamed protein product [Callosobruchus analis]
MGNGKWEIGNGKSEMGNGIWKMEKEALTCNVCDRSFSSLKQLSSHKQKKRHFGIFPSLMLLEHHKEEFEHWSDTDDDILTDSDEEDTVISEECERLL